MDDGSSQKEDDFLKILENGPMISKDEAKEWKKDISRGYKSWQIDEF